MKPEDIVKALRGTDGAKIIYASNEAAALIEAQARVVEIVRTELAKQAISEVGIVGVWSDIKQALHDLGEGEKG